MKDNNKLRIFSISNWLLLLAFLLLILLCSYMFKLSEYISSTSIIHKKYVQNLEEVFPIDILSLCLIVLGVLISTLYIINVLQISKNKKRCIDNDRDLPYTEPY